MTNHSTFSSSPDDNISITTNNHGSTINNNGGNRILNVLNPDDDISITNNNHGTVDKTLVFGNMLKENGLTSRHHEKFFKLFDFWKNFTRDERRYAHGVREEIYSAYIINDYYAFLHIFKCGGTSIHAQIFDLNIAQGLRIDVKPYAHYAVDEEIMNRTLITFVRDPVDHFLTGWQECELEAFLKNNQTTGETLQETYDGIIEGRTLNEIIRDSIKSRRLARVIHGRKWKKWIGCNVHSMSQVSFLVDAKNHEIRPNLKLIGDIHDIKPIFKLIGFEWDDSKRPANRAIDNEIKQKYFSVNKTMLTDETMYDICDYIYMDYCFLDFKPPKACEELVREKCKRAEITT